MFGQTTARKPIVNVRLSPKCGREWTYRCCQSFPCRPAEKHSRRRKHKDVAWQEATAKWEADKAALRKMEESLRQRWVRLARADIQLATRYCTMRARFTPWHVRQRGSFHVFNRTDQGQRARTQWKPSAGVGFRILNPQPPGRCSRGYGCGVPKFAKATWFPVLP